MKEFPAKALKIHADANMSSHMPLNPQGNKYYDLESAETTKNFPGQERTSGIGIADNEYKLLKDIKGGMKVNK